MKLTITPKATHTDAKTRSFSAYLLSFVTADALWSGGQAEKKDTRPIWLQIIGSKGEIRPFVTNLQAGHKAEMPHGGRIELLRSAGYQWHWQRNEHGIIATAYLPNLIALDPGLIDPDICTFVCLTPHWWVAQHGSQAEAVRFTGYLRRRTHRPIFPDAGFAVFLLERALVARVAVRPGHATAGFTAIGLDQAGLLPPIQVHVFQENLDTFLAESVTAWVVQAQSERSAA